MELKKGHLQCSTIAFPPPNAELGDTWVKTTFNIAFNPRYIWSDGVHTYLSPGGEHYVLNGNTWEPKTWINGENIYGSNIWTDGENIYFSSSGVHYVLNGDTWEAKTWAYGSNVAESYIEGSKIWSDGENFYFSNNGLHAVLNGDTWEKKTWSGDDSFLTSNIWSDGERIYRNDDYVLSGNTWVAKTWNIEFGDLWSDGTNIYCRGKDGHSYILKDGAWEQKTFINEPHAIQYIWSDGVNVYHTFWGEGENALSQPLPTQHCVLSYAQPSELDKASFLQGWLVGRRLAGMRK